MPQHCFLSVPFEERHSLESNENRTVRDVEASHSYVSARLVSRIFSCARTYILSLTCGSQPSLFYSTSKNLISHLFAPTFWHPRRHLHSRIFEDPRRLCQWRNWQASGVPNKTRRRYSIARDWLSSSIY